VWWVLYGGISISQRRGHYSKKVVYLEEEEKGKRPGIF
jgi:hypothetical protein